MGSPVMLSIFVSSAEFQETTNKLRCSEVVTIFKINQNFISTSHRFKIQIIFDRCWLKPKAI